MLAPAVFQRNWGLLRGLLKRYSHETLIFISVFSWNIFPLATLTHPKVFSIDGHVCWNSNRRLSLSFADRGKTNFCFLFSICSIKWKFAIATNKLNCHFPLVPFTVHFIFTENGTTNMYILPFQTENGSPGYFPFIRLLYICSSCKTEVCCLSVCWQSNKPMLSICKQNKWTKRACLSLVFSHITSIRQEIQIQNCLERVNDTT